MRIEFIYFSVHRENKVIKMFGEREVLNVVVKRCYGIRYRTSGYTGTALESPTDAVILVYNDGQTSVCSCDYFLNIGKFRGCSATFGDAGYKLNLTSPKTIKFLLEERGMRDRELRKCPHDNIPLKHVKH